MFAYSGAMLVVIAAFTLLAIFYYEYTDFSTDTATGESVGDDSRTISSVDDDFLEKSRL